MEFSTVSRMVNIAICLFGVAIIADILDAVFYFRFAQANGFRWFQFLPWNLTWQYLSSFPGNLLTVLGIAPYLLVWLMFSRLGSEFSDEALEHLDTFEEEND